MKLALTIFLIFSFLGIAVFGIFAMNHGGGRGHNDCVAAAARGVSCPAKSDQISFLNFHLDVLKSFSLATFDVAPTLGILLLLFVSALFGLAAFSDSELQLPLPALRSRWRALQAFPSPQGNQFIHWFALHENSPPLRKTQI